MRFDSNLAWKDATQSVSANRDVLLALAGVFFMLPSLIFTVVFPQPEPQAGATPDQMLANLSSFYTQAWPLILAMAMLQLVGTLAILTLFTDRSRPTVGEALKEGLSSVMPCIGAQLLIGFGVGLAFALLIGVAAATGSRPLAVVVTLFCMGGMIYVFIRTSLVAPVVAVDRIRNPVAALRRSWQLTGGNVGRLLLYFLLLVVAFLVIVIVLMAMIGLLLGLVLNAENARVAAAIISSAVSAVGTLYFVAIIASIHRQLAGPSAATVSAAFE